MIDRGLKIVRPPAVGLAILFTTDDLRDPGDDVKISVGIGVDDSAGGGVHVVAIAHRRWPVNDAVFVCPTGIAARQVVNQAGYCIVMTIDIGGNRF